ncbi:MAG: glycosyl transferase family 2 [Candidatus Rokuibacteriota bacterium]|nr:MAG: glycosyl transferase family 2 [Candidatus Rokubacteria bacterium]
MPESTPAAGERIAWSVVIPAYNEAWRLPSYLQQVVAFLEGRGEAYEVVVVDDGSRDSTAERVREFQAAHDRVRLIVQPQNHGKGHAVKAGMLSARGAFRLFTDADGATPIGELKRLEPFLESGADIVIGSRALKDPAVSVQARRARVWSGRIFNWVVARLGLEGIADSQCGFKCFRGPVAEDLFRSLRTDGFGFDVELLLLAQRRGYRIAEVAVNWADQPGSKVHVLTDGPRMVGQILRVRAALARGKGRG